MYELTNTSWSNTKMGITTDSYDRDLVYWFYDTPILRIVGDIVTISVPYDVQTSTTTLRLNQITASWGMPLWFYRERGKLYVRVTGLSGNVAEYPVATSIEFDQTDHWRRVDVV